MVTCRYGVVDQVVVPEDNDLAEEDWPWIRSISAQSCLCWVWGDWWPSTGQPRKYTVPAEQQRTAGRRDDRANTSVCRRQWCNQWCLLCNVVNLTQKHIHYTGMHYYNSAILRLCLCSLLCNVSIYRNWMICCSTGLPRKVILLLELIVHS